MASTDAVPNFILPGEALDPSQIPTHKKKPLQIGPGLRHIPPSTIVPTVAGQLVADQKKNSLWVEYNGGRYIPSTGDLVIGQVHHGAADFYYVSLSPHTPNALLPTLAFEGATKKTRPLLNAGALVYARVALANKHMDPELECVHPGTGKADGLGPLAGGMVYAVSLAFARRLLLPGDGGGVVVLEELGALGRSFETAVGRNGRVWVASEDVRTVLAVGRALRETDEGNLDEDRQRKLARKIVRELS